ncbi:MAG: 3-deoxy-D-manno-octulosonic acid transferase [Albidovulum sp.]
MARSLALALYLLAAGRGAAGPSVLRTGRPEGRLLWMHLGSGSNIKRLAQLARRLVEVRPGLSFLVTTADTDPTDTAGFPPATVVDRTPPERTAAIRAFLDHWQPDIGILAGASLPPALIATAHDRGIPLVLADIRLAAEDARQWRWRRGLAASLLARFDRVLAQDPDSAARLRSIGGRQLLVEVAGRIEETSAPLTANEAERAALAELLATRPVWLAVACPEAEEEAVIAAHSRAMRLAHRMLLIFVPADPQRAEALAERFAQEGWVVARRWREEEPEPDVQVFLAEGDGELGLWYRLAPVTFMGGTLAPGQSGRNPFEPAALGSAILHGPHPGPYPEAYALLAEARATRPVSDAPTLAEAVGELIAPDKAALLAHNAWAAASGGAEVTERVVEVVLATLDARAGNAAA